ncbi:serine hydrolase [Streptomyces chromofuscus]|uniref:Serine hydrolase n=1 Tax=Streptomyces chromofuscus TaxID=42881 RepID=A0A7M2T7D2_STRCW|nr:serine hydrolase [Streptomyces chromofuscus]
MPDPVELSVRELALSMMNVSDNDATDVLRDRLVDTRRSTPQTAGPHRVPPRGGGRSRC